MTAATAEQVEARLTLVLDYGNPDPAGEPIQAPVDEPKVVLATVVGKRQAIRDQAQSGALPQPPDFSKPTYARFRAAEITDTPVSATARLAMKSPAAACLPRVPHTSTWADRVALRSIVAHDWGAIRYRHDLGRQVRLSCL